MTTVLVTGASGFVGRHVCRWLADRAWKVIETGRTELPLDLASQELFERAVNGVAAIVHLAARVHMMREAAADPLSEYRRVNTEATLALARAAAAKGVRRFVFLSTVKVNGERTDGRPFTDADAAAPTDPYAVSKWEAERGLREIAAGGGLAVTVLRPPLVYGPGVKGNFLRLLRLVSSGAPLPLASVANARSMLYVGNLASAIERALDAEGASGTYLVSDGVDVSTPQLVRLIGAALHRPARLFPCPPTLLALAGRLAGRGGEVMRMIESLRIDCSGIKQQLQWAAPFTIEQGLEDTADWFAHRPAAA